MEKDKDYNLLDRDSLKLEIYSKNAEIENLKKNFHVSTSKIKSINSIVFMVFGLLTFSVLSDLNYFLSNTYILKSFYWISLVFTLICGFNVIELFSVYRKYNISQKESEGINNTDVLLTIYCVDELKDVLSDAISKEDYELAIKVRNELEKRKE